MKTSRAMGLAWLVVVAGAAVVVGRALVAERQTVDDLFIFLRCARNLARRGEYGFNPSEHVEGTSSVAWTLVLAAVWKLGLGGAGAAKAMSVAAMALVPIGCALVLRRASRVQPLAITVPALALALDADLGTWAASGMDTALWTLACVACVALAAVERRRAAAFSLGALAWVRPEGILFAGFGVFALAMNRWSRSPDPRRETARLVAAAAIPVALLVLGRLAYFHELLPNTFWAKMNTSSGRDYTGWGYVASAFERRPLLMLLLPLACVRLGRGCTAARVALALLAASLVFALAAGGDWMPGRRLLVVALPLASVSAAVVVTRIRARGLSVAVCGALVAEGALTFDHAVDQRWRDVEWLDDRVAHWRPIRGPFVEAYVLDWMPTHLLRTIAPYVAPGDAVAHVDVGELPYVMGDVVFLDGFGLVDRAAGRLAFFTHDPGLREAARASFFARHPAVAIVVLGDDGRALAPAQDAAMLDERFVDGWRELDRVPTWGGHPCVTYVRRDLRPAPADVANSRVQAWLKSVPDVVAAF